MIAMKKAAPGGARQTTNGPILYSSPIAPSRTKSPGPKIIRLPRRYWFISIEAWTCLWLRDGQSGGKSSRSLPRDNKRRNHQLDGQPAQAWPDEGELRLRLQERVCAARERWHII